MQFDDFMTVNEFKLEGYPTGDAADWKARYAPVIESEHGEPVDEAALTAIVVTWEGSAPHLRECLEAIERAKESFSGTLEVIIVDNAAPATLRDELSGLWDRWIRFQYNLRLSPARNLGVILASAPIVAFVDDDGLVAQDYFAKGLPYFDDPSIVAIRGRVVARDHPYFTTLAKHYDRGEEPIEEALVTEGASFLRRDAYIEAGGFPDEVTGHEGIALSYRLKRSNDEGRTIYAPDVVLHHDFLDSWRAFVKKVVGYEKSEQNYHEYSPDVAAFMDEYLTRSFPHRKLGLRKTLARTGLRTLRTALQKGARLKFRADRLIEEIQGKERGRS